MGGVLDPPMSPSSLCPHTKRTEKISFRKNGSFDLSLGLPPKEYCKWSTYEYKTSHSVLKCSWNSSCLGYHFHYTMGMKENFESFKKIWLILYSLSKWCGYDMLRFFHALSTNMCQHRLSWNSGFALECKLDEGMLYVCTCSYTRYLL